LGGQMHQATEIKRHQEGNKTEQNNLEGHGICDLRTEFAQKQRSTSGHWWRVQAFIWRPPTTTWGW